MKDFPAKINKVLLLAFSTCIMCPMAHSAIDGAGAINTHDMEMLRQKKFEMREKSNFQEIQTKNKTDDEKKRKEKKDKKNKKIDEQLPDVQVEDKPNVIKATVEEYQTKGVYIEAVHIPDSAIISKDKMDSLIEPILGKNVFFEDIQKVVDNINKYYAENGYMTANAFLPAQTIEQGMVSIELIEGRIGNIVYEGNKWTKTSYVDKRIDSQKGSLFDIIELESDIIKFNRYNEGIRLNASLAAGKEYGTTDITIKSEEKFPFHVVGLFDNAGRETIGVLRGGAMAYADSLFGYRDKLMLGSYISRSSLTPFVDYNIPVNKYDGRVGATFSMSNAAITHGDYRMFNIKSKSYNYSAYYTHPLIRKQFFELNATAAGHYKQATTSFDGYDLNTDKITAAQISLNAKWDTKRGIWYGSQSFYQAIPLIQDASKYFKYEGSFLRLHDFGHGIVGQFRANYQVMPTDIVPYLDQYQAGGLATIRGFSEGLLIGKSGFLISGELLFPIAPSTITVNKKTDKPKKIAFIGKYVKGVVFLDQAGVFPYKGTGPGSEGISANDYLISTGIGLRITLPKELSARVYWGFPLIQNSHERSVPTSRFHFELSMAPDMDYILKHRKRNPENEIQNVNYKKKKRVEAKKIDTKENSETPPQENETSI